MAERVFGFTDIHWSGRCESALAVAMAAQRYFRPQKTIIGGDLLNLGPFAHWRKNKLNEDVEYDYLTTEINPVNKFIDEVQKRTQSHTYFLEGNHDEWFERWLCGGDKTAQAFSSQRPSLALTRNRKNFSYIQFTPPTKDYRSWVQLHPKLIVVHGWAANKYAAQRHMEKASPCSVIFHHTHRSDKRKTMLFNHELQQSMSAGCLCNKQPLYKHGVPDEWIHGFWVAYIGKHSFTMYDVEIYKNYCVMPDGKEIKI